jgi:hypothetical protein
VKKKNDENNGAQENVFVFQAAGSSPADPLFIKTAIRNPVDEPRAIYLSIHGLPWGWSAQIPHAWIWLDGKAEKEIDVMVWPIADINAYKFGRNNEGQYPGTAPVSVAGFIERSFSKKLEISNTFPGSRFHQIGGAFYQVDVRKEATIRIEEEQEQSKSKINVHGVVTPRQDDQQILVDVLLPDDNTHRTSATKTNSNGQFDAVINLLDDNEKLMPGPYRIQAFIFHANELADAESNVVHIIRKV